MRSLWMGPLLKNRSSMRDRSYIGIQNDPTSRGEVLIAPFVRKQFRNSRLSYCCISEVSVALSSSLNILFRLTFREPLKLSLVM